MQNNPAVAAIRRTFDIIPEDPGYIAVMVLIAAFLALTPKSACSFSEDAPAPPAAAVGGH